MSVATRTVVRCLLCGSATSSGFDLGGLLRRCAECGFVWTTRSLPTPADLYDDAYFTGAGYEDYFQPAARRFEAGVRLRWLQSGGPVNSLLEAGSAGGFFVEAATRAGIRASGVEVCPAAARYARTELGIDVATGCFESVVESSAFPDPVDAVCAFHVLEHVEDPRRFLAAARRAVRPGGRLVLEVPNYASVAARRLGPSWPGLQPQFHRWHFTAASVRRLVAEAGFADIVTDTVVFRYYMPARYRRRQARHLIPADVRNLRSLRLTHPRHGDLLRVVARRPPSDPRENP